MNLTFKLNPVGLTPGELDHAYDKDEVSDTNILKHGLLKKRQDIHFFLNRCLRGTGEGLFILGSPKGVASYRLGKHKSRRIIRLGLLHYLLLGVPLLNQLSLEGALYARKKLKRSQASSVVKHVTNVAVLLPAIIVLWSVRLCFALLYKAIWLFALPIYRAAFFITEQGAKVWHKHTQTPLGSNLKVQKTRPVSQEESPVHVPTRSTQSQSTEKQKFKNNEAAKSNTNANKPTPKSSKTNGSITQNPYLYPWKGEPTLEVEPDDVWIKRFTHSKH